MLAALALTGCETSAGKSAKLEREAKAHSSAIPAARGLSIGRVSSKIEVLASALVHGNEGVAAVVTLRNRSATALRDIPIELTVRDAHGAALYTNTAGGLARNLTSVSYLPAHGELAWVDDQVSGAGSPSSATARVGEGTAATGVIPALGTEGMHPFEDPTNGMGAEGNLVNRSGLAQKDLVVFVLARRAGAVVAAGRAVVPLAAPGVPTRFQAFLIGNPQGAQLQASAPPTTFR